MKKIALLSTALLAALSLSLFAEDVKITGAATCAKCTLKTADECQMAITYKDAAGQEQTVLVEKNQVAKDFHPVICKTTEKVNAEGAITEKDGKKILTLTSVKKAE